MAAGGVRSGRPRGPEAPGRYDEGVADGEGDGTAVELEVADGCEVPADGVCDGGPEEVAAVELGAGPVVPGVGVVEPLGLGREDTAVAGFR